MAEWRITNQKEMNAYLDEFLAPNGEWFHPSDGPAMHGYAKELVDLGWEWEDAADFVIGVAGTMANEYGS